jgi:uncharacterized protein YunC (DUF1805 family)
LLVAREKEKMKKETIKLNNKLAEGYVLDMGPVNMVFAKAEKGMVGCGVFDVETFQRFSYPAVKVKGKTGPIKDINDLLEAEAVAINDAAGSLGISIGDSGRTALEKM